MTNAPAPLRSGVLGDVGDVFMGQSPVGSSYNRARAGAPLINGPTEFTDRYPVPKQWTTSPVRFCEPGDILICVRGSSTGRVNIADQRYCIGRGVAAVRARPDCDQTFVNYALAAVVADLLKLQSGSTFPSIDSRVIRSGALLIPELHEQRRIGEALLDIDSQVTLLDRQISKRDLMRQGIRQRLLTGRSRLPGHDAPWKDVRIGDHVTFLKTVPLSRAQLDQRSSLRYLHYGDIHTRISVRLDASTEAMPRATASLAGRASRLQIGDLVFADASEDPAGVGKSVEITGVPESGVVPGLHTIAARLDPAVFADGFKAYLQFIPAFRNSLLRLAAGTKVLATTRTYISGITLMLPEVAEQRAIANVLADADAEIDALRDRVEKTQLIKTGMMQQLLSGRTRLVAEVRS